MERERIATAGEEDWDGVHRRLHRWNRILRERGVAELTESIMIGEDLAARVLAGVDGERRLTDVRHLAQLLHRAAAAERSAPTALRGWLAQQIAAAEQEDGEEERTRRLESDAQAVQILTIHRSKGLEFPIVYCPFLWSPGYTPTDPEPVLFHDPAKGNRATIDVGLDGPGYAKHRDQHHLEERGEELRLAYVALTRASTRQRLVGGRVGQPALAARPAAARQGAERVRPGRRRDDPTGRQAARTARRAAGGGTGVHQRRTLARGRPDDVESAGGVHGE